MRGFHRPCIEYGCPNLTEDGARCPAHARAAEARRSPHRAAYRDRAYQATRLVARRGGMGPCVDCGTWEDLTVDHVIPLAAGGTNDPENLEVRCRRCNSAKGPRRATTLTEKDLRACYARENGR